MTRPRSLEKLPVTMSPEEVAPIFNRTAQTIKNWCRSGKLKATKIDKDWFIYKEHIRQLLEEGNNSEVPEDERR